MQPSTTFTNGMEMAEKEDKILKSLYCSGYGESTPEMPRMLRGAGMDQKIVYIIQEIPELPPKMMTTPNSSSSKTSGISHHFFSWRANFRNSLKSDHMRFCEIRSW
jgi:hypothetical protein